MHCISYVATAMLAFVGAQAVQLGVHDVGHVATEGHEWLKSISAQGPTMACSVNDETHCVVGSGMGTCTLEVDLAEPIEVGPTDSGFEVDAEMHGTTMGYPFQFNHLSDEPLTVMGYAPTSHWNICWKPDEHTHRKDLSKANVEDYCYYVNGLCWLWASPCSGGCTSIVLSDHAAFCPSLRYATDAEFSAALPTMEAERHLFFQKCAASVLDPYFIHCDYANNWTHVENGHWDELVLRCPGEDTVVPPTGGTSAVGDPHLQNMYGERFDLMKPGKHVLINIPRGALAENALLQVEAEARRMGGKCADMYFQELNITGSWVEATKKSGGLHFKADDVFDGKMKWEQFGKVELKVVHGRTAQGIQYLNLYVKHIDRTGLAVGGLLGEDDHSEAAISPTDCGQTLSLIQGNSD